MTAKTHFTTKEAARIVGFRSPYMVDYLHRSGVVVASKLRNPGRGKPRLYNYSDLLLLKAMKSLLDRRIPVAKLKQAQRDFRFVVLLRQIDDEKIDGDEEKQK